MHRAVHQAHRRACPERAAACRRHEDRAQREHVRRARDVGTHRLFRGEEARRAKSVAGRRQTRGLNRPRDPEVEDAGPVLSHDDVAGLQISVDQTALVNSRHGLRQRRAERLQFPCAHRALGLDALSERRSWHVRRGQPGRVRVRVRVNDRRRVETADGARRGHLGTKPGAEAGIGGELVTRDLHGDGAPSARPGQVNDPHAALAELAFHRVRPNARCALRVPPVPLPPCRAHSIPRVRSTDRPWRGDHLTPRITWDRSPRSSPLEARISGSAASSKSRQKRTLRKTE